MLQPLQFRRRWTAFPALVLLLSGVIALPFALWYWFALTALQKHYLPAYLATSLGGGHSVSIDWVYKISPRRRPQRAQEADVVPAPNLAHPEMPLQLSLAAQAAGWTGLMPVRIAGRPAIEEPELRGEFFAGESLAQLLLTPLLSTAALFALSAAVWGWFGRQSKHEERHGRRTKGPELVSARRSNRGAKADGIRLRVQSKLGPLGPSFRIPRKLESSHILLMGDTGSGKSNAIRQILRQVQRRGETAIVYDPAGEFVAEFYSPKRGDLILNPLDQRCPQWNLASELLSGGTAEALAAAILPEKDFESRFFTDAPRRVLTRLLRHCPSVQQLLAWMADPAEIEQRIAGTPEAAMLDRQVGPQRAGVLSSLNLIADSLALLPKTGPSFTLLRSEEQPRWVFLTSRPALRERILPLHSAWLDLLILESMTPLANAAKPVWFVLDELASLNRLPQLHTAVTENRKYGNPVVLGFHGRSQLEKRYGQDAEAMLSQPATKIFFKTSEPCAAKWISETLGEIEVERLKESRSEGHEPRLGLLAGLLPSAKKTYAMEIATKPLVMVSEIAGLEPLHGYIKQGNRVVPVRFALSPLRRLQPEFIERKMTVPEPRLLPPAVLPELPPAEVPAASTVTPLLAEPVPKQPVQPEPRKSAFRKKHRTPDETVRVWDDSRLVD